MLKRHRRSRREAQQAVVAARRPPRPGVSATSVDPERTEDVAAWLRAGGATSSATAS